MTPEGRISPYDAGSWSAEQVKDYQRITDFIRSPVYGAPQYEHGGSQIRAGGAAQAKTASHTAT